MSSVQIGGIRNLFLQHPAAVLLAWPLSILATYLLGIFDRILGARAADLSLTFADAVRGAALLAGLYVLFHVVAAARGGRPGWALTLIWWSVAAAVLGHLTALALHILTQAPMNSPVDAALSLSGVPPAALAALAILFASMHLLFVPAHVLSQRTQGVLGAMLVALCGLYIVEAVFVYSDWTYRFDHSRVKPFDTEGFICCGWLVILVVLLSGLGFGLPYRSVSRELLDLLHRPKGRCLGCGYSTEGLPGPVCPECGRSGLEDQP